MSHKLTSYIGDCIEHQPYKLRERIEELEAQLAEMDDTIECLRDLPVSTASASVLVDGKIVGMTLRTINADEFEAILNREKGE